MTKWRYHSILLHDLSVADSRLNAEGEKGWELVSICLINGTSARAFLKKRMTDNGAEHSPSEISASKRHDPIADRTNMTQR
jgi:hypothetical protein